MAVVLGRWPYEDESDEDESDEDESDEDESDLSDEEDEEDDGNVPGTNAEAQWLREAAASGSVAAKEYDRWSRLGRLVPGSAVRVQYVQQAAGVAAGSAESPVPARVLAVAPGDASCLDLVELPKSADRLWPTGCPVEPPPPPSDLAEQVFRDLEPAAAATRLEPQPEAADESAILVVGGHRFEVLTATLTAVPGSFFEGLLARLDMGGVAERIADEGVVIDRPGELFGHVLEFLSSFPLARVDPSLDAEACAAVLTEADFYMLEPLKQLMADRLGPNAALAPADLANRELENSLRNLLRTQRDAPALADLHVGLVSVYDPAPSPSAAEQLSRLFATAAREEAATGTATATAGAYPLLLEGLNPTFGSSVPDGQPLICKTIEDYKRRFSKRFPRLIEQLAGCPQRPECGWMIAGGAALSALHCDEQAASLFGQSDVDIFIYARTSSAAGGEAAAAAAATQMAKEIYDAVTPEDTPADWQPPTTWASRPHTGWNVNRTLFTLNIERPDSDRPTINVPKFPIQIILRVYDSPAEVLLGFDVDCSCVGFDGEQVWALPRALAALKNGYSILNPLHSWPIQPSYELRLAKYAARGFPVAVPGLRMQELDFRAAVEARIVQLKGLARLLHIHLALAFRNHTHVEWEQDKPRVASLQSDEIEWQWTGVGTQMRFIGTVNKLPPIGKGKSGPEWPRVSNIANALRSMFGDTNLEVQGSYSNLKALPTESDQARMIIADPYGWISDMYQYDSRRGDQNVPEASPDNALLKVVQVRIDTQEEGRPGERRWQRTGGYISFERAWEIMLDCGRDDLHVPRYLSWSVLPRSREYLNMAKPYAKLWQQYFDAAKTPQALSADAARAEAEEAEVEDAAIPAAAVGWQYLGPAVSQGAEADDDALAYTQGRRSEREMMVGAAARTTSTSESTISDSSVEPTTAGAPATPEQALAQLKQLQSLVQALHQNEAPPAEPTTAGGKASLGLLGEWSPGEVSSWLETAMGLSDVAAAAAAEEVDGEIAIAMDNDAWKELGAGALKAAKIMAALRRLRLGGVESGFGAAVQHA